MKKSDIRKQVEQFCLKAGHPVEDAPTVPDPPMTKLKVGFIADEFMELLEAVYPGSMKSNHGHAMRSSLLAILNLEPVPDVVEVADALGDLDYVVEGMRLAFGINGAPIAEEIQRTNMAKFGPGSWKREDGKQMKPPDWQPPRIEALLQSQRRQASPDPSDPTST